MIASVLAESCKAGHVAGCAKYAMSGWTPGGGIFLAVIIIIIGMFLRRK